MWEKINFGCLNNQFRWDSEFPGVQLSEGMGREGRREREREGRREDAAVIEWKQKSK